MSSIIGALRRPCVCFATLEIYPTTPGGAGMLIRHSAALLLECGYDVIFLLYISEDEYLQFWNEDRFLLPHADRIRAYRVQQLCKEGVSPNYPLSDVYAVSVAFAQALESLHREVDIDLVEMYDYCGPGTHWFASPASIGRRTAVRLHSTIELINARIRGALTLGRCSDFAMERAHLRAADAVLYSGEQFFAEDVRPLYPFLEKSRAHFSPPVLWPIGRVNEASMPRDVIFFGRLSTIKGLDVFLQAAALALECEAFGVWLGRFILVGPSESVASSITLEQMKSVIPPLHVDRFEFIGRLDHPKLLRRLSGVAFAAFANKVESFCYAAHELHTAGTPLIVADLPTFRDHFEDGMSAVFFDGTAQHLAHCMIDLAADAPLRARLSAGGRARAHQYLRNHYDGHLTEITPRRELSPPVEVTVLVFSDGDAADEARTLHSLAECCRNSVVLRRNPKGWDLAGVRLQARIASHDLARQSKSKPTREETNAEAASGLLKLGGAVLGLRAGDVLDSNWLAEAALVMGSDPAVAVLSCWTRRHGEIETAVDHLIPEHALFGAQGLRRLIRIRPGLVFAELAAQMKPAGEVSLILAARAANGAVLESPRVGVDITHARVSIPFDVETAFAIEHDRLNPAYLALRRALAHDGAAVRDDARLVATLSPDRCVIRARPDLQPGEVWVMRAYAREGGMQLARDEAIFSPEWTPSSAGLERPDAFMITNWGGIASFPAAADGAIELLKGPFCGAVEIFHHGERRVLRLRADEARSEVVRLSDLFSRTHAHRPAARAEAPLGSDHRERARALAEGQVEASGALVVASLGGWAMRRSGLSALARSAVFDPTELLGDGRGGAAAGYVLRLSREADARRLLVEVSDDAQLALLRALVEAETSLELVALLTPSHGRISDRSGYQADVEAASAVYALARERPRALTVAASDAGALALFESIGVATTLLGAVPPKFQLDPLAGAEVEVVVAGASRLVPSRTHMVAAALLARRSGAPISRLRVPEACEQCRLVAEALGMRAVETYARLAPPVGRGVALSVFPDPVAPAAVDDALAIGFLPIVGPAGLWRPGLIPAGLTVAWWEDAEAIAARLVATLQEWPEACAGLAEGAERGRTLALAEARRLLDVDAPANRGCA